MTGPEIVTTPQTAAREMGRLAKPYARGAFATPSADDMSKLMAHGGWHEFPGGAFTVNAHYKESKRTDWTGRKYTLPSGPIVPMIVAEPGARIPDMRSYVRVYSYVEDHNITAQLVAQGREISAIRISATSDMIACWGRTGSGYDYPSWDRATITRITREARGDLAGAVSEASQMGGWFDDYPLYSDGSWSAVSLRGFYPDPSLGVKPSEMDRKWKAEHPADLKRQCQWTDLAADCPKLVSVVNENFPDVGLERVRLLRMAPPAGKKPSKLARHTDITDKSAGTDNGKITRFHVPLITHPSSKMTAWDLEGRKAEVHLNALSVWYLDARKPHAVVHAGPVDRIHLVVDVRTNSLTRERISTGEEASCWT